MVQYVARLKPMQKMERGDLVVGARRHGSGYTLFLHPVDQFGCESVWSPYRWSTATSVRLVGCPVGGNGGYDDAHAGDPVGNITIPQGTFSVATSEQRGCGFDGAVLLSASVLQQAGNRT